ncbi:pyridoxamine 5'-phosphate oxidase family protein [Luteimicrobium subarcticum]|uniref:Pyridoxamine 5'-phosphate oxidase n=1 Tax=Luteimicrobium subarcticum TaxID=620910 RepID=A0A2M8WU75_9MICO|nr:pyridoxamine 5'-phosphate oxidase family protein [Luteimicrobium subarcticum]PJI94491.1 hypothetical protein CLV34_0330 [Luteimicrobium subarcticum]
MTLHRVPAVPPSAARWELFARQAPDLAGRVRARFESAPDHVLASRAFDGSPRVSGAQVRWVGARLAVVGTAGRPVADDLRRDPRFALHSNPGDGSRRAGDAMVHGRATPLSLTGVQEAFGGVSPTLERWLAGPVPDGYWLDVTSVELVTAVEGGSRYETWTPTAGLTTRSEP